MTRISGNDNIFKGKSSFDIEMDEINSILKRSDNNTLVIADELCRGTEVKSSVIIVTSILDILINNNTRFITATHLHELSKINRLKNIKELKFNHIHVTCDIDNKNIIYDR
jgi:DNA mismatch repair protein MutS